MITIESSLPVPQNRKLARGKGQRLFVNKDYADSMSAFKILLRMKPKPKEYDGQWKVSITYNTRADVDAYFKFCLDAASGIVYADDKQVQEITCRRDNLLLKGNIKVKYEPA